MTTTPSVSQTLRKSDSVKQMSAGFTQAPIVACDYCGRQGVRMSDNYYHRTDNEREACGHAFNATLTLEARCEVLIGERDRQYEFNVGQIAKQAELESALTQSRLADPKLEPGEMCEDCEDAVCRKTAPGPCDCSCHKAATTQSRGNDVYGEGV